MGPGGGVESLCRGLDAAVECEPVCPAFLGQSRVCVVCRGGGVFMCVSGVYSRDVLWVVGVSKGVCLGFLGWRPGGLLPGPSLCCILSHQSQPLLALTRLAWSLWPGQTPGPS